MDYEDAVQECAAVFVRCKNLYEGKVDNPKWFMSLLKISIVNEFNTMAKRCGRDRAAETDWVTAQVELLDGAVDHNNGGLLAALSEASEELREVLMVVAKAPAELLELLLPGEGEPTPDDASWSRRLCRICRVGTINEAIVTELRELFTPESEGQYNLHRPGKKL
jgi:hypothetical protein